ncbi:MAG: hypothetical protein ACE5FT_07680 [Candidatus Nanoarchaeia archaeon]
MSNRILSKLLLIAALGGSGLAADLHAPELKSPRQIEFNRSSREFLRSQGIQVDPKYKVEASREAEGWGSYPDITVFLKEKNEDPLSYDSQIWFKMLDSGLLATYDRSLQPIMFPNRTDNIHIPRFLQELYKITKDIPKDESGNIVLEHKKQDMINAARELADHYNILIDGESVITVNPIGTFNSVGNPEIATTTTDKEPCPETCISYKLFEIDRARNVIHQMVWRKDRVETMFLKTLHLIPYN